MSALIVATHQGTDRLACVHLAVTDGEAKEVERAASALGPVWVFPWDASEPVQRWYPAPLADADP